MTMELIHEIDFTVDKSVRQSGKNEQHMLRYVRVWFFQILK